MAVPPTTKHETHEPQKVVLYFLAVGLYVVSTLYLALFHWYPNGFFDGAWQAPTALWMLYTFLSVKMTKKGEKALVWVLNSPGFEVKTFNIVFVPFLFTSLTTVPREVREREFPDEPENVFKGKDDQPLPVRIVNGKPTEMVRPIRITTGGELPADKYKAIRQKGSVANSDDAGPGEDLNYQMSVEQQAAVRYHIERSFDFFIRMKGTTIDEKYEYAEKEMNDTIVSVLRREYGKRPIGVVLLQLQEIEELVLEELKEATEEHGWGIEIDQVALKSPDITHEVNIALRRKPEESANAKANEMRGFGAGREKRRAIEEIAAGEKKAAAELGMDPSAVYTLEKITEALKPTDKVFLGLDSLLESAGGKLFDRFGKNSAGSIPAPASQSQGGTP